MSDTGGSQPFDAVLSSPSNRREFIRAGLGSMAVGFFGGAEALAAPYHLPFSFPRVGVSTHDDVKVPSTYQCDVLYAWGDPVDGVAPQFNPQKPLNSAADQSLQAGMGHDGMEWFPFPGEDPKNSNRGLLVMNHEYSDPGLLFDNGLAGMAQNAKEMVDKMKAAHGVSVISVEKGGDGKWKVVPSKYSRRITADTPMEVTGPAAGSAFLEPRPDQNHQPRVYGTFNNCAAGKTPWGTYLTCEENFHNYFGSDVNVTTTEEMKRYGLKAPWSEVNLWWKGDERFDLSKHPKEANAFGYVVEIDPEAPEKDPRKLTALGRFKHENAAVTLAKDGRVVVYMGDDEKGEYIYKFVSKQPYTSGMPKADAQKLLETGDLYAASFEKKTTGETIGKWLPLHKAGQDLAHVCVFTRMAADKAGATPMDRPEWVAVHPVTHEVFVTLTNNDKRGADHPVNAANPRLNNVYGHIVKWVEDGNDPAALTFRWDIFLLAGDPSTFDAHDAGKPTIQGDMFGSPDGLKFDNRGRILWIQTDVSAKVAGTGPHYQNLGNNMMLAADPVTGVVHRFLTGPRNCEITGLAMTPDSKTMFVNIQHPGESPAEIGDPLKPSAISSWPHNADRPRSATVVITHKDGGDIGD